MPLDFVALLPKKIIAIQQTAYQLKPIETLIPTSTSRSYNFEPLELPIFPSYLIKQIFAEHSIECQVPDNSKVRVDPHPIFIRRRRISNYDANRCHCNCSGSGKSSKMLTTVAGSIFGSIVFRIFSRQSENSDGTL